MSHAKYCYDHFIRIWIKVNFNFHQIWIRMEDVHGKTAPDLDADTWGPFQYKDTVLLVWGSPC